MIKAIVNPHRVLDFEEIVHGVFWLREHIDYYDECGRVTRIPCGFVLDGYSVPIVGTWLTKYALSAIPCAIHDWDYLTGKPFVEANNDLVRSSLLCGESASIAHILGFWTMALGWISYLAYKKRRCYVEDIVQTRIARTRGRAVTIANGIIT